MTVGRRLEGRLWSLKWFSTLICKPNFKVNSKVNNQKIPLVLAFLKCGLVFLCFQYIITGDMKNFGQILGLFNKIEVWTKCQNQEHFEVISHVTVFSQLNVTIEIKVVLLLSCFMGHPGYFATVMFHWTPWIFCYCHVSWDTRDILLLSCFMGHPGDFD